MGEVVPKLAPAPPPPPLDWSAIGDAAGETDTAAIPCSIETADTAGGDMIGAFDVTGEEGDFGENEASAEGEPCGELVSKSGMGRSDASGADWNKDQAKPPFFP